MKNKKSSVSDNLSSKVKRVFIELPDFSYYHGPSEIGNVDRRFIGRDRIREKFKSILSDSETKSGAYLVSGYRGMGKTSFVSKVLDDITNIRFYPYKLNRFIGLIILIVFVGLFAHLLPSKKSYDAIVVISLLSIWLLSLCLLFIIGFFKYFRKKHFFKKLLRRYANKAFRCRNIGKTRADLIILDVFFYSFIWLACVLFASDSFAYGWFYSGGFNPVFYSINNLNIYSFINNAIIQTLGIIVIINALSLIKDAQRERKHVMKAETANNIKRAVLNFMNFLFSLTKKLKNTFQTFIDHSSHIHIKINLGYSRLTEIDILRLLARSIMTKYNEHRRKFGIKKLFRIALFICLFSVITMLFTFDSFVTNNKSLSESLFIYKTFPTQQTLFLDSKANLVNEIQVELNKLDKLNDESFYYIYNKIGTDFNSFIIPDPDDSTETQLIRKYSQKKQQLYLTSISSLISGLDIPKYYAGQGTSHTTLNKDIIQLSLSNNQLEFQLKENKSLDTITIDIGDADTALLQKYIADYNTLKSLSFDKYIHTICSNTLAINNHDIIAHKQNSILSGDLHQLINSNTQSLDSIYNSVYRQQKNIPGNDISALNNILLSDLPQMSSIMLNYNTNKKIKRSVLQIIKQIDFFLYSSYKALLRFPSFAWLSEKGILPVSINYLFILYLVLGWHITFLLLKIAYIRRPRQKVTMRKLNRLNELINSSLTIENNTGFNTHSFSFGLKKNKSFPRADEREIEKRLIEIIEDFSNFPLFEYSAEFTFIFDELDKVEPLADTDDKGRNGKNNKESFEGSRQRQQAIYELLSNLKYFLSTAKAKFIFIAGREMYDAALADISDRNYSIGSIFHDIIYLDSFLTDVQDGVGKHKITSRIEEYVCNRIIPEYFEPKVDRDLKLYNKYLIDTFDKEFNENHKKLKGEDKIIAKQKREKIIYLLQHLITYLTHVSKGAPHKLTTYFENFVIRKPSKTQITRGSLYVGKNGIAIICFLIIGISTISGS